MSIGAKKTAKVMEYVLNRIELEHAPAMQAIIEDIEKAVPRYLRPSIPVEDVAVLERHGFKNWVEVKDQAELPQSIDYVVDSKTGKVGYRAGNSGEFKDTWREIMDEARSYSRGDALIHSNSSGPYARIGLTSTGYSVWYVDCGDDVEHYRPRDVQKVVAYLKTSPNGRHFLSFPSVMVAKYRSAFNDDFMPFLWDQYRKADEITEKHLAVAKGALQLCKTYTAKTLPKVWPEIVPFLAEEKVLVPSTIVAADIALLRSMTSFTEPDPIESISPAALINEELANTAAE